MSCGDWTDLSRFCRGNVGWAWASADGLGDSYRTENGVGEVKGRDRAMRLEEVPEPGTMLPVAVGAMAAVRRRRRV